MWDALVQEQLAFKTVRFDEVTAQRYGINIESFDLSELIFKVQNKNDDDEDVNY